MPDLIPKVHKESNQKRATWAFIAFVLGIAFMAVVKKFLPCLAR